MSIEAYLLHTHIYYIYKIIKYNLCYMKQEENRERKYSNEII